MRNGGGKGIRTPGLRIANATLSQLSYTPTLECYILLDDSPAIHAGGGLP